MMNEVPVPETYIYKRVILQAKYLAFVIFNTETPTLPQNTHIISYETQKHTVYKTACLPDPFHQAFTPI